MTNDYIKPTQQYKNVEFDYHRVHLLWNCCAIVKRLLELETKLSGVEHKVENIPDDIDAYFSKTDALLVELQQQMALLEDQVVDNTDDLSSLNGELDDATTELTEVAGKANTNASNIVTLQTAVNSINTNVTGITDRVTTLESQQATMSNTVSSNSNRILQLETKTTAIESNVNALNTILTADEYYDNAALTSTITAAANPPVTLSDKALWHGAYGGFLRLKVYCATVVSFNATLGYITGETAEILRGTSHQNTSLYGMVGGFPSDGSSPYNDCYVGLFWDDTNNRFNIVNRGAAIGMQAGNNNVPFIIQFLDVVEQ